MLIQQIVTHLRARVVHGRSLSSSFGGGRFFFTRSGKETHDFQLLAILRVFCLGDLLIASFCTKGFST